MNKILTEQRAEAEDQDYRRVARCGPHFVCLAGHRALRLSHGESHALAAAAALPSRFSDCSASDMFARGHRAVTAGPGPASSLGVTLTVTLTVVGMKPEFRVDVPTLTLIAVVAGCMLAKDGITWARPAGLEHLATRKPSPRK